MVERFDPDHRDGLFDDIRKVSLGAAVDRGRRGGADRASDRGG